MLRFLYRIWWAFYPTPPMPVEPARGERPAAPREAGYPYAVETQAHLGRAASYYLLYAHGRNHGLWGACHALADYEEKVTRLQAELNRLRGGR